MILNKGDIQMSKEYRMSRIFRPETGNTLILPIDHGIVEGNIQGLERPKQVLSDLKTPDIDAVLMTDGIARHTESVFYGKNSPARIQTSDLFYLDNGKMYHELNTTAENAVRMGYDCMKLIMFWDRPAEEQMKSVKIISEVVKEADKWNMPVLVEPLTFEPIEDEEKRIKVLSDAARVAYELGADILKLPHPGDTSVMKEWANNFDVPVIMLGGGVSGGVNELISRVEEAVSVGIRGVAIGRNVWQRPTEEAKDLLSTFANIVHGK